MTNAAQGNGRATLDFGDPVTEVFAFLHSFHGRKLPEITFLVSRKRKPNGKITPEFYARQRPTTKLIRELLELAEQPGHEIFYRVAPMGKDGVSTTEADVLPFNAFWAEVDSHGLTDEELAFLDSIGATIVDSGGIADDDGAKTHILVRYRGATHPPAVNKELSRALGKRLDGDHVHDLTRMLRLPGTYHRKDPGRPVLCTMRTRSLRCRLSAPDVASALGTDVSSARVRKSTGGVSIEPVEPPRHLRDWARKIRRQVDSQIREEGGPDNVDRDSRLWGLYCELVKVGVLEGGHILWAALQCSAMKNDERWMAQHVGRFLRHEHYANARAEWESTQPAVSPSRSVAPLINTPAPSKRDTSREAEFFDSCEELAHIRAFAHSRLVSPWALFGVITARVMNLIPPSVLLPPFVGGTVGLNFFVGIVGLSGDGKGAAESAAEECFAMDRTVVTVNLGSGEGISRVFMRRRKPDPGETPTDPGGKMMLEMHTESAMLSVPEIDTFAAIKGRSSSTISAELRKAWMGERLGFAYADETKRMPMEKNTYRMTLVAGVQPTRAQTLLEEVGGGLPQRFLWMPANDPSIPDLNKIKHAEPRKLVLPSYFHEESKLGQDPIIISVCESARRIIRETRHAKLRGDVPTNPLDSHRNLVRQKLAVAIGHIRGRKEMSEEDWELSDVPMSVSDEMRAFMQAEIARAASNESRNRGRQDGIREAHKRETVEKENSQREYLRERLTEVLGRAGKPVSLSDLQKSVPRISWDAVPDVLDKMVVDGDAVEAGMNRKGNAMYESAG